MVCHAIWKLLGHIISVSQPPNIPTRFKRPDLETGMSFSRECFGTSCDVLLCRKTAIESLKQLTDKKRKCFKLLSSAKCLIVSAQLDE